MKKVKNLFWVILVLISYSCSNEESFKENIEPDPLMDDLMFVCTSDLIIPVSNKNPNSKLTSVVNKSSKWLDGQTLRIKFLNGDTVIQEKTKEYINDWIQYTNLTIQFVPSSEFAEIIIAFNWDNDTTSWSQLGRYSVHYYSQDKPSMNIAWINSDVSSSTFRRTILHEFGHALGLQHEHLSPDAQINWNKPYVYNYFKSTHTPQQIDDNYFNVVNKNDNNYTNYDPYSIMHYSIPSLFTLDGYSVSGSTDLSLNDIFYIRRLYPKSSKLYPNQILKNGESITSPNGRYSLAVEFQRLKIHDNENPSGLLYSITLPLMGPIAECKFENSTLILYNTSRTRILMGEPSLNAEYATITDSGDVHLIKDGKSVWSLFNGKL